MLHLLHHGFARHENAVAVLVARRVGEEADHVLLDLYERIETERGRVADVELQYFCAGAFHFARFFKDRASYIVANVVELV